MSKDTTITRIVREELCDHLLTRGNDLMGKLVDRLIRFHYLRISPVLICGESGSGKEFVARAFQSDGKNLDPKPFHALNCAAVSREFVESRLFGHDKGAFTGATGKRKGILRLAERGVFLDEIDKADPQIQDSLLRYLRTGEIQTLGSDEVEPHETVVAFGTSASPELLLAEMKIKLMQDRLIKAGSKDLSEYRKEATKQIESLTKLLIDSKTTWLRDFLNRVTPFTLCVPPIRHRKDDLSIIVPSFLEAAKVGFKKKIKTVSAELLHFIMVYDWPGNMAEIENFVKAGVAFTNSSALTLEACLECYTGNFTASELLFGADEGMFKKIAWPSYSLGYLKIPLASTYRSLFFHETENSLSWPFLMGKRDRQAPFVPAGKLKKVLSNLHFMRLLDLTEDNKSHMDYRLDRKYDRDKLHQFFKLRAGELTFEEIGPQLGFGSRPTFLKWRRDNHIDGL